MKKPFRPKGFGKKSPVNKFAKASEAQSLNDRKKGPSSGAGVQRSRSESTREAKPAFPRSWRQVAGTHAIKELLHKRPRSVQAAILQNNWKTSAELREIVDSLNTLKIKFEEKPEAQLFQLCHSHQGAVVFSNETPEFNYKDLGWEDHGLVVALDGVEDPHNLGAVLRTSWLMGVHGVIIPDDRAVGVTATVSKVACGGVEHVPIYRNNQFQQPFETLKQAGFWVYGLSHRAKKTIYDIQFPDKVIWVLGAEDKGLRTTTEKICDELVSIPQLSSDASYNVSVSAALAIAETKRQWNSKK
ncbi:MAG: 23S rRNA (guanosine(2251)-2'-O)-methyltransferase RlmB [Bdellovibrionales bacterium RIFCSPHIGHO2_01_FULL_40_29]|nr:MAG: 23S rRNA (guanosine(2251)-2'-O)-methyltransferase RlmB [Bdellovibrionales bacterium RIFCSPHIGHO2_01_FULL_40_29]OFZ33933.1 MAG: 23S rRNA (guanosine(2251)-2'-O)-methyltransferase RlmB [Bdellovibrionales bacterium RIFCSPHIGHO2_02_FULL_40_15]